MSARQNNELDSDLGLTLWDQIFYWGAVVATSLITTACVAGFAGYVYAQ